MTYNLFCMISCCNGQIHMYTGIVAFPGLSLLQLSTNIQVLGLEQQQQQQQRNHPLRLI